MTKIAKIRINNILGIDELEFDAGQFNQISGPNGTGKTSVLEAIKATLRGGHDATLLRTGAEKGETVLVLDDGTEIAKRVTPASRAAVAARVRAVCLADDRVASVDVAVSAELTVRVEGTTATGSTFTFVVDAAGAAARLAET